MLGRVAEPEWKRKSGRRLSAPGPRPCQRSPAVHRPSQGILCAWVPPPNPSCTACGLEQPAKDACDGRTVRPATAHSPQLRSAFGGETMRIVALMPRMLGNPGVPENPIQGDTEMREPSKDREK